MPHLHAGAEQPLELAHELTEIDPLLGGEIERQFLLVPLPLGVGDFHLQPLGPNFFDRALPDVVIVGAQMRGLRDVVRGGQTEDALQQVG